MPKKFIVSRPSLPYIVLLLFFIAVYIWKLSEYLWIDGFSGHLSNFALSGILLLILIGPLSFEHIKARNWVFGAAIILAFANIIVESTNLGNAFTSTTFNTTDFTDALFGIIALLLVVIVYWIRLFKRRQTA